MKPSTPVQIVPLPTIPATPFNWLSPVATCSTYKPKPIPAFTANLYLCRRRDEPCIKVVINKGEHFFYGYGHYTTCKRCDDRTVCMKVHGVPKPYASLESKTVNFDFQLLLFNERRLTETFTVGRFKFERKICYSETKEELKP